MLERAFWFILSLVVIIMVAGVLIGTMLWWLARV